ncbi:PREDICTED: keratinocyte proline-rich protein-like [Drosophila arizonae]|uniref:Keratinocyte proline-rich protein-like n=1 Tax=Drosophila arizonae TaxID=7263 RepID=A0ABM1P1U3_DROAR|nr:PREDICTED: keratinocyte proline-rich protein-like [Drosophila arizonae]
MSGPFSHYSIVSQDDFERRSIQSQTSATLAQIDAFDFNPRPMLLYTFDENFASGCSVCCQECADPDSLEDACKRKRKKRRCCKPRCKPRPCCKPRRCRKPKPRCRPCCKPKPRCRPCCKPKPRCRPCKRKPACPKRRKPRRKPCCPSC